MGFWLTNKEIMTYFKYKFLCILFVLNSCSKEIVPKYKPCDSYLYNLCDGKGSGTYCTFGYKWGKNNPFANAGLEKPGPSTGDIELTFKFMNEGFVFNTHNKETLTSISFDTHIAS